MWYITVIDIHGQITPSCMLVLFVCWEKKSRKRKSTTHTPPLITQSTTASICCCAPLSHCHWLLWLENLVEPDWHCLGGSCLQPWLICCCQEASLLFHSLAHHDRTHQPKDFWVQGIASQSFYSAAGGIFRCNTISYSTYKKDEYCSDRPTNTSWCRKQREWSQQTKACTTYSHRTWVCPESRSNVSQQPQWHPPQDWPS